MVVELSQVVEAVVVRRDEKDKWVWGGDSGGCYTVNSGYKALQYHSLHNVDLFYKLLWLRHISARFRPHVWKLAYNRLPTFTNLFATGVVHQDQTLCMFCKKEPETEEHLFFVCDVTTKIWFRCLLWFWDIHSFAL